MTLWIDVEDLFQYARFAPRPSGIQRLSFEIYTALVAMAGTPIGFVRHDRSGQGFRIVAWDDVRRAYAGMADAPRPAAPARPGPDAGDGGAGRTWTARIPQELRDPLGKAARAQATAGRAIWQALRAMPGLARRSMRGRRDDDRTERPLAGEARPGDVLCALGSPWTDAGAAMVERAKRDLGMRFALLVYDLIPAVRSEYVAPMMITRFARWHRRCLPMADRVFAISACTARDLEAWADDGGLPLARPVIPLPIGTGFPAAAADGASPRALPSPGSYVLLVSTIEARKNHALAFRVWRRLTREMPAEQVPALVFAGRVGWMVGDLMQQIRNSQYLDGKLLLVEDPTDAELSALYAGCRFTFFPSHYEGWGLPVTESLGFGKACLASASSSLPEAGGPFCLYFDPDNTTEATALVRRAIEEPALVTDLEARIDAEFRPVSWAETAGALLRHLDMPGTPVEPRSAPC
ncbi:MAG TPA: glycosyltransferase family 1 protein [Roseomonas sp.]|jgi:glycosyltransferase involved in cell wall biosynthesis